MKNYILGPNREIIQTDDLMEWAQWFENMENRRIDGTVIGNVSISTVFLGIDHNFTGKGAPVLFETMIFGGEHSDYQVRSCTWDEAETEHRKAIEHVQNTQKGEEL